MLRRIPAALALLALLGLAWGASTPGGQQPITKKFAHERHVSKQWSKEGEVLRDCRGCHDYSAADGDVKLDLPTERCANCHDPDGYWQDNGLSILTAGSRVDPADEEKEKRLFKHRQHQDGQDGKPLACAYCHHDTKPDGTWAIRTPADFLENQAYCTSCHDNEKAVELWTDEEHRKREKFNAGLDREAERRARTRAASARPVFSHAAHMTAEELASAKPEKCAQCHASIEEAPAGTLAETQFDVEACAKCHTGLTFEASDKTASGERFTVPSPTAGVFSHAQHLGPKRGKQGIDAIGPDGCLRCHEFEPSAERRALDGVRSFRLKPFLARPDGKAFQGCVECHHEVKLEDHGNVDGCAQCHIVEAGSLTTKNSAMRSNRPVDQVERADPASFTFPRQSHKFISKGLTADAPASCTECHRAKLADQPSRIDGKAFSHATHLGMQAIAAGKSACAKCHASIAASSSLKEMVSNHDLGACVECHGRTAPVATLEASAKKQVFRFDHEAHVGSIGADGRKLACETCHASSDASGKPGIDLHEKIAECTLCHGHPERADARVNRFSKGMVDACRACHVAGVPKKDVPVQVGRALLAVDDDGWQKHEGTARCTACHIVPKQPFAGKERRKKETEEIEIALRAMPVDGRLPSPHDAQRALKKLQDPTQEQLSTFQHFYDVVSCVDCHFSSLDLVNFAYAENAVRSNATHRRVKEILTAKNWRTAYRKTEGDNLGGGSDYPGGYPGIAPKRKR